MTIPDGTHVRVKYLGTVHLNNGLILNEVLYVPGFQYNLVSVHRLCWNKTINVSFVTEFCVIQEPLMRPLLLGRLRNNLYYVEENMTLATPTMLMQLGKSYFPTSSVIKDKDKKTQYPIVCAHNKSSNNIEKIKLWHLRPDHIPFSRLQVVFPDLQCNNFEKNYLCNVCPLGNQTKKVFQRSSIKMNDTF